MNDITSKKDIKINWEIFERKDVRELAFYLVELHMDMFRRGDVLESFKRYLRGKYPFHASVLIEEIDRAMADYKAKPTE